jgi:cytochrome c oxidase subunit 2
MTAILRRLMVALTIVWLGSTAIAQPTTTPSTTPPTTPQTTGSGSPTTTPVPNVTPADKGTAAGTNDGSQAAPGATTGSGDGSAIATGSAAGSAAGSGAGSAVGGATAPATPVTGPGGKAWYDVLANRPIEEEGTFWMPKAVNAAAAESDVMFYSVLGLSAFFFFAIAIAVIYFVVKYRHRPGHKPEPSAGHNDTLEITWTIIPTIICVFLFWYGWRSYIHVVTPPQKAVEINVIAWRWNWQFTHQNGVTDSDLHVPVNTPVRLVMTSKDVLHAFYAPAFRVKQDVIPRRYTYVWFYATKPGTYRLTCAEYCGTSHAQMACLQVDPHNGACLRRAVVVVHSPGDYERYLADKEADSNKGTPEEIGAKTIEKKGCVACHTTDGTARVGPTFKMPGTWGTMITLADGTQVKMDENYLRESMMSPQAKARPGFPPSMPSFEGQLKENEIMGLIALIKSLKQ